MDNLQMNEERANSLQGDPQRIGSEVVQVTVRFVTIMQRYSGNGLRDVEMVLPSEPRQAVDLIIERFGIPWKGELEKYVRIFINGIIDQAFFESGEYLKGEDIIAFVPISSGG
jgi:hypothetical protein